MKFKFKTFISSTICLLSLFGCERNTLTSSDSSTESSSTFSSDSSSQSESTFNSDSSISDDSSTTVDKVDDGYFTPSEFNQAISNYKVNFTGDFFSLDFFGENAIYIAPVGASLMSGTGYVNLESDHSVWVFDLDGEKNFSLQSVLYGSVSEDVDFLKSMNRYQALDVLLEDGNGNNWKEISEHTYETNDDETVKAIMTLGGFVSGFSTYTGTTMTMTTYKDKIVYSGKVTRKYRNEETEMDFNLTANNIGINKNDSLDEFLKNPIIPEVNDFSDEFKEEMNSLAGFCFDYSENLTKYCYYDLSDGLYYEDHRSGNVISEFEAQLIKQGFKKDVTNSTVFNGAYNYQYTKVLTKQTDTSAEIVSTVNLQYCPKSYYVTSDSGVYNGLYEDGLFMIRVSKKESLFYTDINDMNTFLKSKYKKADGSTLLPTLNLSGFTSISMSDQMSLVGGLGNIESDYKITGKFSDGATALSQLQAFGEALVANGIGLYVNKNVTPVEYFLPLSEDNLDTFYHYSDSSNPKFMVNLSCENSSTKLNDGSFTIIIAQYYY